MLKQNKMQDWQEFYITPSMVVHDCIVQIFLPVLARLGGPLERVKISLISVAGVTVSPQMQD
jgi:hypothetical protein